MQNIIFVWYNENKFVFNNYVYPFIHNMEYLSTKYNIHLVYYIEKNIIIPKYQNIKLYDFNIYFKDYIKYVTQYQKVSNKIDIMKLIVLSNYSVLNIENDILLMDFDCEIININPIKYDIEPFFDGNIKYLMYGDYDKEYDSYIENYAVRINKNGEKWFKENLFFNMGDKETHSDVFVIYVNLIIKYYKEKLYFIFPKLYNDLIFNNSIKIILSRGESWTLKNIVVNNPNIHVPYLYNKNIKPIYFREYDELYRYILFENDKLYDKIMTFKNRNYNFDLLFKYSNKKNFCILPLIDILKEHIKDKNLLNDLITLIHN